MESEKSHSLLFARQKARKAGVIVHSESEDLRTREADDISLSPRAKED